jgi:hypothetical protein
VRAHGIEIELPARWSGRIFGRAGGIATLHAGDFQLAIPDGEFGDRSTARMPAVASFVVVTEYLPGNGLEPGRGLYASSRLPLPLDPIAFRSNSLAHPRFGQLGMQHFFTKSNRPFCLYLVVAGPRANRRHQLSVLDHVLRSLQIQQRAAR